MSARQVIAVASALFAITATTTACGSGDQPPGGENRPSSIQEGTTTYPVTLSNCGTDYTYDGPPERVVVMNGGSVAETSSLLALGVGDRIVANAQSYGTSDVPGRAEAIAALPTGGITLNDLQDIPREAMIGLRPDLVISTHSGGFAAESGFATREDLAGLGANTYVPATACGEAGTVTAAPTIEDSHVMLRDLGLIFDVSGKAEQLIADSMKVVDEVSAKVQGRPVKKVVVVFPGMGTDDLSSIAANGVWNDILARAGAENPFADSSGNVFATVSKEQLAATPVDALVLVNYMNPDPEGNARKILAEFPQWPATRDQRLLVLSDSIYFGPSNDVAVDRIARLVHPDAF
ncbi:MAG TPA: ABC transporter substrate-binding protein [Pseudonocardiaceae bacterium]